MYSMYRGSQQRCFLKIGKKIFAMFTEKHPCRSLFFNRAAGPKPENIL